MELYPGIWKSSSSFGTDESSYVSEKHDVHFIDGGGSFD